MNRSISCFFSLLLLLFTVTPISSAEELTVGGHAYVRVAVLNVRARSYAISNKVGSVSLADRVLILQKGTQYVRIGEYGGYWYRIRKGALVGWVYGPFLSASPVMTADQVEKLIQGTFYYHDVNDYNHIKRILYIRGKNYEEKIYKSGEGLVDVYFGRIAFQADSIEMFPRRRRTKKESARQQSRSGYQSPSYSADDFKNLPSWSDIQKGRIKYFLFYVDNKLYLTVERPAKTNDERKQQFKRVTWVYITH